MEIIKKVFQNVYGTFSNIEAILYLLKGEAFEELGSHLSFIEPLITGLCFEFKHLDKNVIKVFLNLNSHIQCFK